MASTALTREGSLVCLAEREARPSRGGCPRRRPGRDRTAPHRTGRAPDPDTGGPRQTPENADSLTETRVIHRLPRPDECHVEDTAGREGFLAATPTGGSPEGGPGWGTEETGGRSGGRPRLAGRLKLHRVPYGRLHLGGRRPAKGLRRPNRGRKRGPGGPSLGSD